MLTTEEQNKLTEGDLVNYQSQRCIVYRRINDDQVVIYPANSSGRSRTVCLSEDSLTMLTDAELLAHRLMGRWRDSDGISAFVLATSVAEELPRLALPLAAKAVKSYEADVREIAAP